MTSSPTNILCHSYYIVRRGNVSVPDMYNFHGMYRYSPKYASNWRAVAAFFIGCVPPLPGFVNSIVVAGMGKTGVSLGGQHLLVFRLPLLKFFYRCTNKSTVSPLVTSTLSSPPVFSTGDSTSSPHTTIPSWTMLRRARTSSQLKMLRMWRLVRRVWQGGDQALLLVSLRFKGLGLAFCYYYEL